MLWKLEKPFAQALSQRTLKSLQDDLNYILETDIALKTALQRDNYYILEKLLTALCR
jgi:DNA polymerase III delta subunit